MGYNRGDYKETGYTFGGVKGATGIIETNIEIIVMSEK